MLSVQSLQNNATQMACRLQIQNWNILCSDAALFIAAFAKFAASSPRMEYPNRSRSHLYYGRGQPCLVRRCATDQARQEVINAAQGELLLVSFTVYIVPHIAHALISAASGGATIRIALRHPAKIPVASTTPQFMHLAMTPAATPSSTFGRKADLRRLPTAATAHLV